MALRIEDYALIGDCQTGALVGNNGSIDWLCLPRFDSPACFAALLGNESHGCWQLAPTETPNAVRRHYRDDTLILETDFETSTGEVTIVDCMPIRQRMPDLVRIVIGRKGTVSMRMKLVIRFDYGSLVPWVRSCDHGIRAIAGPAALILHTPVKTQGTGLTTTAEFTVDAGQQVPFFLSWYPSNENPPPQKDPFATVQATEQWWRDWSKRCCYNGPWREAITRSLITLRALLYDPTGGMVAALTTSLPEQIASVRNWDYRFCWLRDATFTLLALVMAGYKEEAAAWRNWLLRAVAGSPEKMQIMYSVLGERRLTEQELSWLPGYEQSKPVRIGNAASEQFQLDVYGEVLDLLYQCRHHGIQGEDDSWPVERSILKFLSTVWRKPDEGIWEIRGPRQNFTHSKIMAWVAFDRGIKSIEQFGLTGPLEHWKKIRQEIHTEVCRRGFNSTLNSFVQSYDGEELDASLLMIPLVGFLPPEDPRVQGTVTAIQRDLLHDGFVKRYNTSSLVDGLPPGEGAFLPCTFWLADALAQAGRHDDARQLFERLLAIRNDVGLLSEEYAVDSKRLVGNFPQAFTHVGLINTATNLSEAIGAAEQRKR